MGTDLFHVFRNTPLGRDTFLASCHICKKTGLKLTVYVPKRRQFLMYFANDIVTLSLNRFFTQFTEGATENPERVVVENGLRAHVFVPRDYTVEEIPKVPVHMAMMTCPRSLIDPPRKVTIGHLGQGVRNIIRNAEFSVLLPTATFKPWNRVVVLYGGSQTANNALQAGRTIATRSGVPLEVLTFTKPRSRGGERNAVKPPAVAELLEHDGRSWNVVEGEIARPALMRVPSDALVVLGAFGHGPVKEAIFGSTLEKVVECLPNPLLVIGPNFVNRLRAESAPS